MAQVDRYRERAHGYIAGVLSGEIVASATVRHACQRHLDDLERSQRPGSPIYFDEQIAAYFCSFFPLLTHTSGVHKGKPFELCEWQVFIAWVVFGWRRSSDGMRRFVEVYLSVARGNGKSAFAAALLLLVFGFDSPVEERAECYTVATKEDQAAIVFNDAKAFVEADAELKKYIVALKKNLHIPRTNSYARPIGSDSNNTDGLRPHCVVADEVHAWRPHHRELWDKLVTAFGKRAQAILIVITTAGTEESDLWGELDDTMRAVIDPDSPIEDDTRFAYIAELDADDDPLDESKWLKASPMLAYPDVLSIETIRREAVDARRKPELRNRFVRYRANRIASSSVRLIPPERWRSARQDLPDLAGVPCHAGFDWGWRDDLTGLACVFPLDTVEIAGQAKRRYAVEIDAWIPEDCPHDLSRAPWSTFIRRGELTVTRGNTTDTAPIYARLEERIERHGINTIALDPNNCREFGTAAENVYGINPFWFGQTCGRYNEPLLELLAALDEGRILAGDNSLLGWCMGNMVALEDSKGYRMPSKKKSRAKIDPAVAVIMALSECLFAEREDGPTGMILWA